MSIYKRKNSRYYYCEIKINGNVVIRSTKTTKKSLALRFESQLREELYRQQVLGDRPTITLADAIQEYASSKMGSVNQENLDTQIRTLNFQLSRVYSLQAELHGLNGCHLTRLVSLRRKDGVTEGTIRLMLTTLKGILNWSKSAGYLQPDNLVIPRIRVNNQRTRILSQSEEIQLLERLRLNKNPDDYDLVVLLLDTAARLNEIQQLRWDSVDLKNGEIHLWRTKTNTESIVKLTDRSLDILNRRQTTTKHSELVFPSKKGGLRRTTPKSIQNVYKELGLQGFCTHSIRHTTASKLVKNGMSLFAVSKLLGHSNISMSQRYSHLEQKAVANQAVEILNNN
ncbi:site-specific integrase [Pseudoalteromonas sp. OFAV1]|uniref:integrase n=1 Tax=Pseudoalteromonas sp. OFAV1 TaxID=2908892 RepID=UPI001F33CA57|nr:site-specific integrase [Pseudoalteromonas sp. OFAV1]MCF2901551.1 site-specific integrase [Pseudoalteromonas sp. OFAV1]